MQGQHCSKPSGMVRLRLGERQAMEFLQCLQLARIVEMRVLAFLHELEHVEGEALGAAAIPRVLQCAVGMRAHAQFEARAVQRRMHVAAGAEQDGPLCRSRIAYTPIGGKASRACRADARRAERDGGS